ncbi:MAG: peroxide stress protein YaaA [Ruminococcus sp.]|uniref:peroxide stress protein YaaA n=1 Tax=Ruminococcus sp. TaxID=41978 RepID=UPI002873E51F|nr:peroxide stress protein YaaA [Ruminococcus sp.]MBQ3285536.1 peroxide stress protein YaaA [Ruminococcus sp.]
MRMIISPAKQMRVDTDTLMCADLPVLLDKAERLKDCLNSLSYEEQKKLWVCNDKIAAQNRERIAGMDLTHNLTPAILAYDGIQYTYMAPSVFEDKYFEYVQEHLRILSGFYGVLRPMDGVTPYRLEMQTKLGIDGCRNLYDFWNDSLYREVLPEDRVIINLASKEYSKCIERYLQPQDRYITIVFGELSGDKVVTKGVYAKMARGEMVRFAAEIGAEHPEQLKAFDRGYRFDESRSTDTEYVFIRNSKSNSLSFAGDIN